MKTRRKSYLRGWSKQQPGTHERTLMLRRCGKKCFLGPKKTFPICAKKTCKVNRKGLYSALIRAEEWSTLKRGKKGSQKYRRIASKARRMLRSRRR